MHRQLANANVFVITHASGYASLRSQGRLHPSSLRAAASVVIASASEAIQLSSLWLLWIASLALAMTATAA
jgi:hypothetical protein